MEAEVGPWVRDLPPCPVCGTAGVVVWLIEPVVGLRCPRCYARHVRSTYFAEVLTTGTKTPRDPSGARHTPGKKRSRYDQGLIDRLRTLYQNGHTIAQAARAAGIPENRAYTIIRYHVQGNKGQKKKRKLVGVFK